MPLTAAGKIDRGALPHSRPQGEPREDSAAGFQTEMERTLGTIWQEILKTEVRSRHENFFDLGGHSLSLVRVLAKVKDIGCHDITMVDLFRYPTVHALAQHITGEDNSNAVSVAENRMHERRDAGVRRMKQRRVQKNELGSI